MAVTMKLRIKELREEYSLTQKELAQKLSNVQRNVSNWENGASEPDCETILKIAELFGVSIDELFGRSFSPEPVRLDTESDYALLRTLRKLTPAQKSAVKNLIDAFIDNAGSGMHNA